MRARGARDWVPGWPVWLLCAQVSIVYGFAALAKLNPDFLSGSVVASYLRRDGPLAVPGAWRSLEPMLVLSLLAICSEAFLAFALWMPRWRPAAMVVGLGLHVFIAGWLSPTSSLIVFSLLMLPLYLLFLDAVPRAGWWSGMTAAASAPPGSPGSGGWTGCTHCASCRARELAAAEPPVSEDAAARALQVVLPNGRVRGGFAAVTRVAEILPVSYLWAPLLRLPPIAAIGEAAYRRVAERRRCECRLPPGPLRSRELVDHPAVGTVSWA